MCYCHIYRELSLRTSSSAFRQRTNSVGNVLLLCRLPGRSVELCFSRWWEVTERVAIVEHTEFRHNVERVSVLFGYVLGVCGQPIDPFHLLLRLSLLCTVSSDVTPFDVAVRRPHCCADRETRIAREIRLRAPSREKTDPGTNCFLCTASSTLHVEQRHTRKKKCRRWPFNDDDPNIV